MNSTLLNIMDTALFQKWYDDIERKEFKPFDDVVDRIKNELSENLPDDKKELLSKFKVAVENNTSDIYIKICKRVLNMGVRIGMELGTAFVDIDNGNY